MYNQLTTPILKNLHNMIQKKTQNFLNKLIQNTKYPINKTFITYNELNKHILKIYHKHHFNLIIYNNHNHNFFSQTSYSTKKIITSNKINILLIPLTKN